MKKSEDVGRIAGEVGDQAVGCFQIEHLEDGVIGGLVLALDDGVCHAGFLDSHVVLEHSLAMEPDPGKVGRGHADLDLRICLHIQVHVLGAVGAEPQLAALLQAEHEGAALGLAVTAYGSQILDGVGLQKSNDFFHNKYLLGLGT